MKKKTYFVGAGMGSDKKCPVCGKKFVIWYLPDWVYKDTTSKKYFCSYTCYRAKDNKKGRRKYEKHR